ncbi:zinc dependent phospholipase C [Leptospira ryugenii]|uniref:Zinc dependent phospholipase C n=1 Tax=Leptospira ryugenii TaxID=1917863 RepID=A0A2P2DXY9_9LEPT|nr:zinc dependent phospholipase C family protein [Leptospira ryugenii]GBF49489.1 zinc dependent phospholipase C [Leptospira ryugenii]
MAGKITHIEALSQVKKHLEHGNATQRKIATLLNRPDTAAYANLGAVAPDIFYFYHVLQPQRTKKAAYWGDLAHHHRVVELILNFLDAVHDTEMGLYRDRFLAFTLGYICHCVVDIQTHPYIFYISGDYYSDDKKVSYQAQINHMKVEFGLDTLLLHYRWGMSAREYDFPQYIDIRQRTVGIKNKMDPVLWQFWLAALKETFPREFLSKYFGSEKKIIPGDILNESYMGFYRFTSTLDSRSPWMRGLVSLVDSLTFHRYQAGVLMLPTLETVNPKIMNEEKRPWNYPADPKRVFHDSFIELLNQASAACKEILTRAYEYSFSPESRAKILDVYGGYNLDTGLRYQGIDTMKEFSPL